MLEGLTNINWDKIQGRDGSAKKVPEPMYQLCFGDKKAQVDASYILEGTAINQGTLYEAAYYLTPFLQEVLQVQDPEVKVMIYNLLYEISSLHAFDMGPAVEVDSESIPLKQACRQRVIQGRSLYYTDLANNDVMVRFKVFELLLAFTESFETIHKEIMQLIRSGTYVKYYEPQKLMLALEIKLFPD
jgi:hypothetical protein